MIKWGSCLVKIPPEGRSNFPSSLASIFEQASATHLSNQAILPLLPHPCSLYNTVMYPSDVIIIGGGPGGTRAAKRLALAGKKVVLIADDIGGECLNFGCIPTKTYLWTAELFEKISNAATFGIDVGAPQLNWQKMKARQTDVVSKLKKGLRFITEKAGAKILEGRGELQDAHTVKFTSTSGAVETLQAEFIILATGSSAFLPEGFSVNNKVVTNREILDLPEVPKTLLVVGSGAVGVEFASIFHVLGSKVTVAEMHDRLLLTEDHDVSAEMERLFLRRGIEILKNTKIGPEQAENYDVVLVATGRKPQIDGIGLEAAGVTYEKRGVTTNDTMQTNVPNIFAIGDLAGKALLAYTAEREADIAAETILGQKSEPLNYSVVANTIFSLPEVSSVGLTEAKAKEKNIPYIVGKGAASTNAKALILGSRDGFAKIIAEKSSHKILGIHMIGERVTELVAEASLAISMDMTLENFSRNIHSHPILGEIIKDACEAALFTDK